MVVYPRSHRGAEFSAVFAEGIARKTRGILLLLSSWEAASGPAWGSPIQTYTFQSGRSPENSLLAGGWSRLNPRRSWRNIFAQPGEEENIGEFNCSLLL